VRHSVAGDAKKVSPPEATADCRRPEQPPATSALLPEPHATSRAVRTEACLAQSPVEDTADLEAAFPKAGSVALAEDFPHPAELVADLETGLHAEVREGNFVPAPR